MDWLRDRSSFEKLCDDSKVPTLVNALGRFTMQLDPIDVSLTPCLVRDGYWEAWVSLAIARAIQPGWTCVDAGANVGYYSLLMARQGASKIMAIEPHPRIINILLSNVLANRLESVITVREAALSGSMGEATMKTYKAKGVPGHLVGSSSFLDFPEYEVAYTFKVKTMPLDQLVSAWKRIDFIKVDIEGAERDAWSGMAETLKRHKPIVCMEVDEGRGYDVDKFIETIKSSGMRVRMIDHDGSLVEPCCNRLEMLWCDWP